MKRIEWKLLCGLVLLALFATSTYAESPREQLKQMVEQLQKSPTDNALREQIIKLAQKLKPAPAVPEEAVEFEGRAQFAFKNAKSNDDYLAAAREYEKAVTAAPWVSGYYSDLCTIYEKAGKLEEAKRNCEFSLIGLADSAQITDIKRRIAGLKYGMEQNSPSSLEGGVWLNEVWSGRVTHDVKGEGKLYMQLLFEVRNSRLIFKSMKWYSWDRSVPTPAEIGSVELKNRRVSFNREDMHPSCNPFTVQFSDDGEAIEESYTCGGQTNIRKYMRKH